LKKSKLTRKETENYLDGLNGNQKYLYEKLAQMEGVFNLYLEYRKETDKFSKFVKARVENIEKERSKAGNKKGA
jgi:hypothetical protein